MFVWTGEGSRYLSEQTGAVIAIRNRAQETGPVSGPGIPLTWIVRGFVRCQGVEVFVSLRLGSLVVAAPRGGPIDAATNIDIRYLE